jgi:hypothetical protein
MFGAFVALAGLFVFTTIFSVAYFMMQAETRDKIENHASVMVIVSLTLLVASIILAGVYSQ